MTNVAATLLIFLFSTIIIIWYNIISFNREKHVVSSSIYAWMNGGPAAGGMPLNIKKPRSSLIQEVVYTPSMTAVVSMKLF